MVMIVAAFIPFIMNLIAFQIPDIGFTESELLSLQEGFLLLH